MQYTYVYTEIRVFLYGRRVAEYSAGEYRFKRMIQSTPMTDRLACLDTRSGTRLQFRADKIIPRNLFNFTIVGRHGAIAQSYKIHGLDWGVGHYLNSPADASDAIG